MRDLRVGCLGAYFDLVGASCLYRSLDTITAIEWRRNLPNGFFSLGFPSKSFICISKLHMLATCSTYHVLLHFMTLTIFGELNLTFFGSVVF
jgi:hypothetical protein